MRKLLSGTLTIFASYLIASKFYRQHYVRDVWADNEDLSAQCVRHFSVIGIAQKNGSLTEEKLRWHLEQICWYASQIVDPIYLPSTLFDHAIHLSYGNFWLSWSRDRIEQLEKDELPDLRLVAS